MKVFTQIVLVLWGLALIGGGIAGYVKANSTWSLVAGAGFGVAMIVEALLAKRRPMPAFFGASALSLLLVYFFGKKFWESDYSDVRNGILAGAAVLVAILAFVAGNRSR